MPPLAIGLGVAGAASVASAGIQAGAAGAAAEENAKATNQSIAFQKEQAAKSEALQREFYNQSRADLEPLRNAQTGALSQLSGLGDINNPLYQQQRQVNTEAIQRQLAAQGLLRSRAQGDQLSQLELGLNQQRIGTLQGLAGLGGLQQTASLAGNVGQGLAGLYQGLGQQVGSAFQQQGQVNAQSRMAQGQAIGQGLSSLGNLASNFIGSNEALKRAEQQQAMQQAMYQKMGWL